MNPAEPSPVAVVSAPAERGWFQIHLITALAMMVVAGALLGANLKPGTTPTTGPHHGWPIPFINYFDDPSGGKPREYYDFFSGWAVFDGAVIVLSLVLTAFIFEAGYWGWSRGKIFLWTVLGAAVFLHILMTLHYLINESYK